MMQETDNSIGWAGQEPAGGLRLTLVWACSQITYAFCDAADAIRSRTPARCAGQYSEHAGAFRF